MQYQILKFESMSNFTTWLTIALVLAQLTRAVKVIEWKQPFQIIVPFAIRVAIQF